MSKETTVQVQTRVAHMRGRKITVNGNAYIVDADLVATVTPEDAKKLLTAGNEWSATIRKAPSQPIRPLPPGASMRTAVDFIRAMAENPDLLDKVEKMSSFQSVASYGYRLGYKFNEKEFHAAAATVLNESGDPITTKGAPKVETKVESKEPTKGKEPTTTKGKGGKGKGAKTAEEAKPVETVVRTANLVDSGDDELTLEQIGKASDDELRTLAAARGIDYDAETTRDALISLIRAG